MYALKILVLYFSFVSLQVYSDNIDKSLIETENIDSRYGSLTVKFLPWEKYNDKNIKSFLSVYNNISLANYHIIKPGFIKSKKEKGMMQAYSMRQAEYQNKKYNSFLYACERNGYMRLIDISGPKVLFDKRHEKQLRKATGMANQSCYQEISKSSENNNLIHDEKQKAENIIEEIERNIDGYWYIGYLSFTVNGYVGKQEGVLTLKDKTVTDDIDTVLEKGIKFSRKNNPNRWGKWRLSSGKLQIRWQGRDEYKSFNVSKRVKPGKNMEKYGCFEDESFSSLSLGFDEYNFAAVFDSWCFQSKKRFTNDRSLFVNQGGGGVVATGNSQKGNQGRYALDGYFIKLFYDNGEVKNSLLGTTVIEGSRLLLVGSHHYSLEK
jgi:hypothetical protein